VSFRREVRRGLLQHWRSWVLRNSLAMSAEEATTTGTVPSLRYMRGPYFWESLCRERCGSSPNRWRFPIKGRFAGPGGSFCLAHLGEERSRGRSERRKRRKATADIVKATMIDVLCIDQCCIYMCCVGRVLYIMRYATYLTMAIS